MHDAPTQPMTGEGRFLAALRHHVLYRRLGRFQGEFGRRDAGSLPAKEHAARCANA